MNIYIQEVAYFFRKPFVYKYFHKQLLNPSRKLY